MLAQAIPLEENAIALLQPINWIAAMPARERGKLMFLALHLRSGKRSYLIRCCNAVIEIQFRGELGELGGL